MRFERILAVLLILSACKEYVDTPLSPAQKKRVESARLAVLPKIQNRLDVNVEDQLRLLGVDLSTREVKAGDRLVATFYLESLHEVMEDNQVFIHFQCRGPSGFHNLDGRSVTRIHPLRKFKKGERYADRIEFQVNQTCRAGQSTLYWGLFRGADRLKFTNTQPGQVSSDGRLKVATIQVKSKPIAIPTMDVKKRKGPIEVDGKLNENEWKQAKDITLSQIGGNQRDHQPTKIQAVYDDQYLYLGIYAEDKDIWSTFTERDSNTWEQEVIEVFIDALGHKKNYIELQVTPRNVLFDARFTSHRSNLAKARAWNMPGLETAVFLNGTLDKRDDTDQFYSVEMKIPHKSVPGGLEALSKKEWRINFFRFDKLKSNRQQASGWSRPPVPDFHHLDSFGRLKFMP